MIEMHVAETPVIAPNKFTKQPATKPASIANNETNISGMLANAASLDEKKAILRAKGLEVTGDVNNIWESVDSKTKKPVITINSPSASVTLETNNIKPNLRGESATINIYNSAGITSTRLYSINGAKVSSGIAKLQNCKNCDVTATIATLDGTKDTSVKLNMDMGSSLLTGGCLAYITNSKGNTVTGSDERDYIELHNSSNNTVNTGNNSDFVVMSGVFSSENNIDTGDGRDSVNISSKPENNTISNAEIINDPY